MAKVGTAYIEIKPDLTGFARELKTRLAAAKAPQVKVEPDTENFRTKLRQTFKRAESDVDNAGRTLGDRLGGAMGKSWLAVGGPKFAKSLTMWTDGLSGLLATPIGLAAAVVAASFAAALVAALIPLLAGVALLAAGVFGQIKDEAVQKKAKALGESFTKGFAEATAAFKPAILTSLDIAGKAVLNILKILKPAFDALAPSLPLLTQAMADFGTTIAKALADPAFVALMTMALKTLAEKLPGIATAIAGLLAELAKRAPQVQHALNVLFSLIEVSIKVIGFLLGNSLQNLYNWMVAWNNAKAAVSAAVSAIRTFWNGLTSSFNASLAGWRNNLNAIRSWFAALPGQIVAAIGNLGSLLYNAGRSVVDGFLNGIRGSWYKITDAVRGLVNRIPSGVRNLLDIFSPSKVMAGLGREVPRGFAQGIRRDTPKVGSALDAMVGLPRVPSAPIGQLQPQRGLSPSLLAVLSIDGKFFDLRVERLIEAASDASARDLLAGRRFA